MTKRTTKRALLTSMMSLFLCFTMLLGTTYAWFTDTVSSANNIITAGNLDIELKYAKVANGQISGWETVAGKSDIFDPNALWEPGRVEVVYLEISNLGTLALKYQLGVNAEDTVIGQTVDGKDIALSKHLVFAVVEMPDALTTYTDREAVALAAGTEKGVEDYNGETTKLEVGGVDYVALIVYMPESVGNEANYKFGTAAPQISLGINLYATQQVEESDSFGNDYDAGAYLPIVYTADELKTALANNASVRLGDDIVLSGEWTPVGDKDAGVYFTGTLDGAGHTISGLNVASGDYVSLISAAKNATIVNLKVEGTVSGENAAGIVARVEGETVIQNCVSNVTVQGSTKAGGIVCNVTGADAKIINCTNNANISGGNSGIGGIVGYVNNDATLEIINCSNTGNVTSDNNKYAGAAVGYGAGTSKGVVAGFQNTGVITGTLIDATRFLKDGDTVLAGYVGTPGNWIAAKAISTADQLVDAFAGLKAGDVLYIIDDIDMTGKTVAPVTGNKGFTMMGNGHTISNLASTASALFVDHSGSSAYTFDGVVLENCSVKSANNYGALFVGDGDTSDAITITNCHVKNCTVESAKYAAAFVAYTAGWNVINDGPVYSDVLIQDCSVVGGSITGGGSTAAAIGHAGGNADTTSTVTNMKMSGVAINGEDKAHTGIVVGTANVGKTYINNATYANVTGNYNTLYGRFVPGETGEFKIDGAPVLTNATSAGLEDAIASDITNVNVYLPAGTYSLPSNIGGKTVTISGSEDTVIKTGNGGGSYVGLGGASVTFNGVTIQGQTSGQYNGYAHAGTMTYENCTFEGTITIYSNSIFRNCTFNLPKGCYVWTAWGASEVTYEKCTFNTAGKALLIYHENGTGTVNVYNCVFNATAGDKAGAIKNQNCAAIEIDNSGKGVGTNTACNFTLNTAGNTYDSNFSGEWRIKTIDTTGSVKVNGVAYTTLAIDGKTMTIDANQNVTVN